MAVATTLSSVGTSVALGLNPVSKTTLAQVSISGTSSLDVVVQVTLDDPTTTATPVWASLSTTHISSVNAADGLLYTIITPIAGLRLSSSTFGATTTVTLKALQSVTA